MAGNPVTHTWDTALTDNPGPMWTSPRSLTEQFHGRGYQVYRGSSGGLEQAVMSGTSSQRAELTVLIQVLKLGKEKMANIYTDGRYAFAIAYVHGAIYHDRGLLTAEGKTIKGKQEGLGI